MKSYVFFPFCYNCNIIRKRIICTLIPFIFILPEFSSLFSINVAYIALR